MDALIATVPCFVCVRLNRSRNRDRISGTDGMVEQENPRPAALESSVSKEKCRSDTLGFPCASRRCRSGERRIPGSLARRENGIRRMPRIASAGCAGDARSEEHTSELQSRENLVCRLLLEKKKQRSTA